MEQRSFGDVNGFRRQNKVTRREKFLEEMERVMSWKRLEGRIAPAYPVAGNGRRPYHNKTRTADAPRDAEAAVEHPFRVLKCQFGYRKARYRGLFKNEQHLFILFALTNIYQARRLLMDAG